jgi:predicted acylesterase/phospholipase RssA
MMLALMEKGADGHSVFNAFMARPGPFEKAKVMAGETLAFLANVKLPAVPGLFKKPLFDFAAGLIATDPALACPYSFLEFGGWYSADHFVTWLQKRLDNGTFKGQPRMFSKLTLKGFYDATQSDLSVVASDTTAGEMLVLNHRTAPDVPLVWAVRMSMSIPLLWQEVLWLPEWGKYLGRDMANHAIVDGGLLSNFPIELFVSHDQDVLDLMGSDPGDQVLGMLIDETLPVNGSQAAADAGSVSLFQAPAVRRIASLVNTATSAHDKMVIDAYEKIVVRLPAMGYGTTEFDMPAQKREILVNAGCEAMSSFFDKQAPQAAIEIGVPGIPAPAAAEPVMTQEHANKIARRILKK